MHQLTERFKIALETVGGTVRFAREDTEAVEIIREICQWNKVKSAVIARGLLTERLKLKSSLNDTGIDVKFTSESNEGEGLKIIEAADLGITDGLAGVAETGTVVSATRFETDRLVSALPPNHVVLLEPSLIVPSLGDLIALTRKSVQGKGYTLSLITGPSSTADIEKILVRGVHGPHSLFVILMGAGEPN